MLGVDVEATPFIVLAALASLGLAFAAWMRPRSPALLLVVALAMLAFDFFSVREVAHQIEESEGAWRWSRGSSRSCTSRRGASPSRCAELPSLTGGRALSGAAETIRP